MFALEITFQDGVSPPEILLVRRSNALIGISEFAHIVVDGAPSIPYELRLTRGLGREFHCHAVKRPGNFSGPAPFAEGLYSGEATISLGDVSTYVTALDADVHMLPNESPDRAGVRILRSALTSRNSMFPAIAVLGATPIFLSFPEGQAIVVGRSRKCGLRLDSSNISGEHARIGSENGQFWVEDLGSTNGTFVNNERISGRRNLSPEETVVLATEFSLAGVRNLDDVASLGKRSALNTAEDVGLDVYPALVCKSELVRPSRLSLKQNKTFHIGRDPASDVWVGAPHISRKHVTVSVDDSNRISVTDSSSNGTYLNDELLDREKETILPSGYCIIDLKEGIRFGVCRDKRDEDEFHGLVEAKNTPFTGQFIKESTPEELQPQIASKRERLTSGGSIRSLGVFQRMAQRDGNRAGADEDDGFKRPSPSVVETAQFDQSDFSQLDAEAIDFVPSSGTNWLALVLSVVAVVIFVGLFITSYLLR